MKPSAAVVSFAGSWKLSGAKGDTAAITPLPPLHPVNSVTDSGTGPVGLQATMIATTATKLQAKTLISSMLIFSTVQ